MLDDALLARTLIQMPLADADILGHAVNADPTTVRRHLALWQERHLVRTVTPPHVGPSVSDLYYVTPLGFRTWSPDQPLEEVVRMARLYHCDLLGLCKHLPHIPERLTLYDMILRLVNEAKMTIPSHLEWYCRHHSAHKTFEQLDLLEEWVFEPHITVSDDRRTYHLTFAAQMSFEATAIMNEQETTRWFSIGIWIDDGLITEAEMRRRLSTMRHYAHQEHRNLVGATKLLIVTSHWVRYRMWQHVVRTMEILDSMGILLLLPREHGWPYTSGMTLQDEPWYVQMCHLHKRLQPAELEDLFAVSGSSIFDVSPEPPAPVMAEIQRRYFAPENTHKGLVEWLHELGERTVRRAMYSVTLSQREHQVLTAIAIAPGISTRDLCTQCDLQPTGLEAILAGLRRRQLIMQETITSPKNRPGIPGYDGQNEHVVQVCRATEVALDYLDQVYYRKLFAWHRTRKAAPIHDAGVLRCLTIIETVLRDLDSPAYMWWQVGPRAAIRFTTFNAERWQTIIPDAHGVVVTEEGDYHRFWVEYDNDTESREQLWDKFATYIAYLKSREEYEEFDERAGRWKQVQYNLLIIVPTHRREEQISEVLDEVLTGRLKWRVYFLRHDQIAGGFFNPQVYWAPADRYYDDFLGVPTPRNPQTESEQDEI